MLGYGAEEKLWPAIRWMSTGGDEERLNVGRERHSRNSGETKNVGRFEGCELEEAEAI
jgi:hypothetical protein